MVRVKQIFLPSRVPSLRADASSPARDGAARSGIFSALRYSQLSALLVRSTHFRHWHLHAGHRAAVARADSQSDPLALGIVGALQFGPLLVLGPFGGAIADRWPRRNVLIGTQVASGVLALVLWALTATGAVQLWQVFVLAALLGLVNAVDMPTRQAFVSEMVPADDLLNAVSLNSAQFNASRIVGPGLAGGLIALLGGTSALFLFNAVELYCGDRGLLDDARRGSGAVPHSEPQHGLARLRAMGDGIRFVLERPKLRVTFLMIAVIGTHGFQLQCAVTAGGDRDLAVGRGGLWAAQFRPGRWRAHWRADAGAAQRRSDESDAGGYGRCLRAAGGGDGADALGTGRDDPDRGDWLRHEFILGLGEYTYAAF